MSPLIDRLNGPIDALHALLAQPGLGGGEQAGEDLGIVDGLEQAEVPGRVLVALDVQVVHLRADAADRLGAAIGDPELRAGVLEERVLLGELVVAARRAAAGSSSARWRRSATEP